MNAHYVYKITNINPVDERQFYIGVRTAPSGNPEEDTEYMGSSVPLDEAIRKQGLEFFSKEILSTWETRELAEKEEKRLHREIDVATDPLYYNIVNSNGNIPNTKGKVTVLDTRTNTTRLVSKEDFNNFDYYQSPTLGKVSAIDKNDGTIKIVSKNEFNQNGDLVGVAKNKIMVRNKTSGKINRVSKETFRQNHDLEHLNKDKVVAIDTRLDKIVSVTKKEFDLHDFYIGVGKNTITVFDKTTAKSKRVTKEEFDNNGNLVAVSKHSVTVIDLRDKSTKRVSLEDFKNCEYYIHPTAYKISIFDDNDNLVTTIYKDFVAYCKKMGYPEKWLRWSYKNDGQKIYQQEMTTGNKLQAERKGYLRFKGWSAITETFK